MSAATVPPSVVYRRSHEPTPAQHAAGNYRMTPRRFAGLDCTVETKAGEVRRGVSRAGVAWETRMLFDYGYVKRSTGVDGDHVDCFLGPNEAAPFAYIVRANKPGVWTYDEDKVMLGFDSAEDAEAVFHQHYSDPRFFGGLQAMPIAEFRSKVLATRGAGGAMIKSQEIMRSGPRLVLLKATVKKLVPIATFTKKDGTVVPAHSAWVNVNPDVPMQHVLAGQGSASQKAAHKKLSADPWWYGLDDDTKFHTLLLEATEIQAKWSLDATVSVWLKKTKADIEPTEAEWKAFFSLPAHLQTKKFMEGGGDSVLQGEVTKWAKKLDVPVGGVYGQAPAPAKFGDHSKHGTLLAQWIQSGEKDNVDDEADPDAVPMTAVQAMLASMAGWLGAPGKTDDYKAIADWDYEIQDVPLEHIKNVHQPDPEDYDNASSTEMAKMIAAAQSFKNLARWRDVLPALLSPSGAILDGHHRWSAAQKNHEGTLPALIPIKKGSGKILNIDAYAAQELAGAAQPAPVAPTPAPAPPEAPGASSSMWAFNPKDQGFSYVPTLTVAQPDGGLVYVAFTDEGFQVGSLDAEGDPRWYADHEDLPKALHELAQHEGVPKISEDVLAKLQAAATPAPTPTAAKPFQAYGKYDLVPIEVAIPVLVTAGWQADGAGGFVLSGKLPHQTLHSDGLSGGNIAGTPKDWLVTMMDMAAKKKADWAAEDEAIAKKSPPAAVSEAFEDLKLLATDGTYYQKIAANETPYLAEHLGKWTGYSWEQKLAAVLEHAKTLQAKASASAAVSLWKKAALEGKNPTPGQWKAYAGLPLSKRNELQDAVETKVGLAHLVPPKELWSALHTVLDASAPPVAPVSPLAAAASSSAPVPGSVPSKKNDAAWAEMTPQKHPVQLKIAGGQTPAQMLMDFKKWILAGTAPMPSGMLAYLSLPKPKLVALREALKAKVGDENFVEQIKQARGMLLQVGYSGFSLGSWKLADGTPFEPLDIDGSEVMKMPADDSSAPTMEDLGAAGDPPAADDDTNLAEGSDKIVDGIKYVLHDHRWHKVAPPIPAAPPKLIRQVPPLAAFPIWHNTEPGHNKFWGYLVVGTTLYTRYGPIGKPGQISTKQFASHSGVLAAAAKLVAEKKAKGYTFEKDQTVVWPPKPVVASASAVPPQIADYTLSSPEYLLSGFVESLLADKAPNAMQMVAALSLGEDNHTKLTDALLAMPQLDLDALLKQGHKSLQTLGVKNIDGLWYAGNGKPFQEWAPPAAMFDKLLADLSAAAPPATAAVPHQWQTQWGTISNPPASVHDFLDAVTSNTKPTKFSTIAYLSLPQPMKQQLVDAHHLWDKGTPQAKQMKAAMEALKEFGYTIGDDWQTPAGKPFAVWTPSDAEFAQLLPGLPHQLSGKVTDPIAALQDFLSAIETGNVPSPVQSLVYLSLPLVKRQHITDIWNMAEVNAAPLVSSAMAALKAEGYFWHDAANQWATADGKLFEPWEIAPEAFDQILTDLTDSTPDDGPKEGEHKQGADGMLVFHDGRWHKDKTAPAQVIVKKKSTYVPVGVKNVLAIEPASVTAWISQAINTGNYLLAMPAGVATVVSSQPKQAWVRMRLKFLVDNASIANKKPKATKLAKARLIAAVFGLHHQAVNLAGAVVDGKKGALALNDAQTLSIDPAFIKLVALKAAWLKAGKRPPADLVAMLPSEPVATAAAVAPPVTATPTITTVDGLPTINTKGWKQVGPQEGYNDGGYFDDPATGEKYYLKFPSGGEAVVRNEILANRLYALAGCKVPTLTRCVRDGKVGLASLIVAGSVKDKAALLAGKMPGLFEGFAADAWLANWDTVGNNPAAGKGFDNIQRMPDGSAVRIDAGGSLLYGGAGSKKGQFTNEVVELKTMRDASINANTAAVFGKMTDADIAASVANVLKIPNALITETVLKFGPGDAAAKFALATKLVHRKDFMVAQYPAAAKKAEAAIAAGPTLTTPGTKKAAKPDPTKLSVNPSQLPELHNFLNWSGSGKPISDKPYVLQNIKDEEAIRDFALKGNLVALKAYKFQPVGQTTGMPVGAPLPMEEHPSGHVRQFYDDCVLALDQIANPPEPLHVAELTNATTVAELAAAFPPFGYGVSVGKAPGNQRLGFWIALGSVLNPAKFVPPVINKAMSAAEVAAGHAKYKSLPSTVKTFLSNVQGSGSANQPYRDGKETDSSGQNCRKVLADCYANASPHASGTTIYKWINMTDQMVKQLLNAPDGLVFQNPGSMCTSYHPTGTSGFGHHRVTMHFAPGAVGMDTFGSGSFHGEKEITTIPGQRFMILSKKMVPSTGYKSGTRLELEVLMLPPDQSYIANLGVAGAKKA